MSDATVSAAGLRIVKLLVGNPPQTVADLILATGVTRTAVTEQLNELVAAGFVDRATERLPGRGRPRHLYSATRVALLLLFASNQSLVVPAIWQAIRDAGGEGLVQDVLKRVSRCLADYYNRKIKATDPQQRLREMIALLAEEGGLVEAIEEDGQLVLYKRSCPFVSMADDSRSICCVDQDMMTAVVGCPVRRTACRHEGAPCCTFEIVPND
jgi:DeoR family transcriptional regulator, suf operon transcriptional repressor